MSECLHHGIMPTWFNTWALGFPLQSNLTWGIFSTPQMLISSLFRYNIYTLHVEFVFYVVMSGCTMFYLLKKHFIADRDLAQLLACCFMLSGFVVGSSQWLLYVTAASFAPLMLHGLLRLIHRPSPGSALLFAVLYYLMFTSVYLAFNIISTYIIIGIIIFHSVKKISAGDKLRTWLGYLLLAATFTILLCLPCLYYSAELIKYLQRGDPITSNSHFFESNYVHPASLRSLLLPFSSVRMHFPNTEGTMMDAYFGLFPLLMIVPAILSTKKENRSAIAILLLAIIFLLLSFGAIIPLRGWFNILPGFSYFRNPGIFRFYFIFAAIVFIAQFLSGKKISDVFDVRLRKRINVAAFALIAISLFVLMSHAASIPTLDVSFFSLVKNLSESQSLFISAGIQFLVLSLVIFFINKKYPRALKWIFIADLVINVLMSTPYFTVSSYSLKETDRLLQSVKGFPVQANPPSQVEAMVVDLKGNPWMNINVYKKEISSRQSYWGPLVLKNTSALVDNGQLNSPVFDHEIIFADSIVGKNEHRIIVKKQFPNEVVADCRFSSDGRVQLLQNYFPGWTAEFNGKKLPVNISPIGTVQTDLSAGNGNLKFSYKKSGLIFSSLIVHLIVLFCLAYFFASHFSKKSKGL
jgi:hypothetical protein